MVKWNEARGLFHVDLYDANAELPWTILAIRDGVVVASHQDKTKQAAWEPLAEAIGMRA